MSDTYEQEARRFYGVPEWELSDSQEWTAYVDLYDMRVVVSALDYSHPQGEWQATVWWHSEDSSDAGVYRTRRDAMRAAYQVVLDDRVEYLSTYDGASNV